MSDDPAYLAAKRHVEAVKGLYIHGLVFGVVMTGLVVLNLLQATTGWWVQWPLAGWGIGILCHALAVYQPIRLFGDDWTERKIRERLDRRQ